MTEYYEPTLLFRQNAIRRFQPDLSPIASVESFSSYNSSGSSSWLLRNSSPQDTQVLNKSCSLDKLNIKSNYWKIPENDFHMTAMSVTNEESVSPTLALASGAKESNLFIYELDTLDSFLVHHKTISLPNIYSMKWVPGDSRLLMTGNNKGYAHLIMVPSKDDDESEQSAEICKRFNHRKHLRNKSDEEKSASISKIGFSNENELISIYSSNLFNWDVQHSTLQGKPSPISFTSISGLVNFDTQPRTLNTLGICGKFGASMYDLRSQDTMTLKYTSTANNIKFNPDESNQFATSYYDGTVKLFDVRNMDECVMQLRGHKDRVSTIEWNNGDLFTGGNDGNIIHWDLTEEYSNRSGVEGGMICSLKDGLDSVRFDPKSNSLADIGLQRQCGTILPASNTNIISMCSVKCEDDLKMLSVDGSSFFGLHSKIYNTGSVKTHYTEEDIQLMLRTSAASSNDTLIAASTNSSQVSLVKPLSIVKRRSNVVELTPRVGVEMTGYPGSASDTLAEGDESDDLESEEEVSLVSPRIQAPSFAPPQSPISRFASSVHSASSDFNFIQVSPRVSWAHSNQSGYSVQSDSIDLSSPETVKELFNDSMDTLSTCQTFESPTPAKGYEDITGPTGHDWYSKALSYRTENHPIINT